MRHFDEHFGSPTITERRTSTACRLITAPIFRWGVTKRVDHRTQGGVWQWHARLAVHLALASVPVLAISAHVFWSLSLLTVAWAVLLPLAVGLGALVVRRPYGSDRLLLAGFLWGVLACAGYDAFRLPTIYAAHWWTDFFGSVGGWATASRSSYLVGYLWRYAGDGGGIAVAFFALAATLGAARWPTRTTIVVAVGYAVSPVWSGLVLTDLLAPGGRELFTLSATTLLLSLVGHLIYGAILGFGYCKSRRLEAFWPLQLPTPPPAALGRRGRPVNNGRERRHFPLSSPESLTVR
jgi:hypothetical protein